jgi:hypothetical protein
MTRIPLLLAIPSLLALPVLASADALPAVGEVDAAKLRAHCKQLLEGLDKLKAALPAETERGLKDLLKKDFDEPAEFAEGVQKLLDPLCLAAVSINPESRVKALRGPAAAELKTDAENVLLVKVVNEAGTTPALQVMVAGEKGEGKWLEAAVATGPPFGKGLSGQRLEYAVLRLTPRESGKREATLRFDVGQGTQDLGFRAEVPVLFTVKAAKP